MSSTDALTTVALARQGVEAAEAAVLAARRTLARSARAALHTDRERDVMWAAMPSTLSPVLAEQAFQQLLKEAP